jgi:hypothetical protein
MDHPSDQLAAARDLLADGATRSDAVAALAEQFGVSTATAYRRVAAAADLLEPAEELVDLADAALATMLRLMRAAEARGDETAAMERAVALASAVGKLKTSRIRLAQQAPAENSHENPW